MATANAQGELSPLEIGMHALHYVEKGQGKKGAGLQFYADSLGKQRGDISKYRDAAEVAKNLVDQSTKFELLKRANHLAAIHKLPEEARGVLLFD